jgi:predicted RNA-binding Zn ribbon-like protein
MSWYPRLGLPPPFELVNTSFADAGEPHDALATPAELDEWIEANGEHFPTRPHAPSTAGDLERFRQLRHVLRNIFDAIDQGAAPGARDIDVLNEISAAAPQFVRLEWSGTARHLRIIDVADAHTSVLATVARAAIELLGGPEMERISHCQRPGCVLFFLKERRSSQWCSSVCGNRARVARHYARRHARAR